jgi:YbbR domain-containing protein
MIPYAPPKLSWPKDWFIKLISLLFAIFLWYFVSSEDRVDMNIQVPVEIVNLPRDLVISNPYKNSLDVTVSGPRGLIRRISQGISRSIDLSKATPGNLVIANDPDSISVPRGVNVLRINPTHITLLLDRLIKKELPIKAITHGRLPEEYELVSIAVQPPQLDVAGPQEILGQEVLLQTKPIDLTDVTASTSKQISLDLSTKMADLIGDPMVTAQIEIKDKMIEKEVGRIEVTPTGLPPTKTVKISPTRLTIKTLMPMALAKRQGKTVGDLFTATVNLDGLQPGPHKVTPILKPPPEVTIEQITPETVTVEIK